MAESSRAKRLKGLTNGVHDRLDRRIMAADPFASQARYVRFLRVQYAFHRHIHAIYDDPELEAVLPDLKSRRRLALIAEDLRDLGDDPHTEGETHFTSDGIDIPEALGWLYVAEGSNLGAAFLLKYAAKLGLDAHQGARHLAAADAGRASHWRTFTQALDTIGLTEEEEFRVEHGAREAFEIVHALVDEHLDAELLNP